MTDKSTKKLSAIIACYQDALAIPIMYQRLSAVFRKLSVEYEIIFVNDHSPDNTKAVLRKLVDHDPRVIAINHTRNFGSQSAFTSGMNLATGDAIILLDGDLQDPPEIIELFYLEWLKGYDVVYGQRTKRDTTIFLQLAYKLFYRLFKKASYVSVPLDAGDFSLLDKKVVTALKQFPERDRFLRGLRAWVGFNQIAVPYTRPERMFGKSTNSLIKNFWWARKAIFSFSYKPLDAITWLALVSVAISVFGIILQVFLRLVYPDLAPRGFATLIILMLFIGGIQMLCLSIIGTYLSHIYEEVKQRPVYLVESIWKHSQHSPKIPQNMNKPSKQLKSKK